VLVALLVVVDDSVDDLLLVVVVPDPPLPVVVAEPVTLTQTYLSAVVLHVDLVPRAGFQAIKLSRVIPVALTMELHVSSLLTSHTLVQLATMPLWVGSDVGCDVEAGAVRVVGVPGIATQ
jgi:hypothetical protein